MLTARIFNQYCETLPFGDSPFYAISCTVTDRSEHTKVLTELIFSTVSDVDG
jgi:hypothetical protein